MLPEKTVIIVDESSLISSKATKGEVFHFGTDILLDDLLTFSQLHLGAKIIFVGDPAQLSPVGDNNSNALREDFFAEKGLNVSSAELTEIQRQSGDGMILKNAMKIRNLLDEPMRYSLSFDYRDSEFEMLSSTEVIQRFCAAQPTPQFGENIVICFSNTLVKEYNDRIRRIYFPGCDGVQCGDILQIVKNDYNHFPVLNGTVSIDNIDPNLYNGDFVKVLQVAPTSELIHVSFWKKQGGKSEKVNTSLSFRDIELITIDGRIFKVKILETLLENDKASLTQDQHIALYRLFRDRHKDIVKDLEAMQSELRADPYYNAIHVKYGYAITAHKSQGGEWENAFVDFTERTGLSDDNLRWAYTATTRATRCLFAVNAPNITPFSKFSINKISSISKTPKGIAALANIDTDDDVNFMSNFRKWKYVCTKSRLNEIGCSISSVVPMQYLDRYIINTPSGTESIDCWYNDANIFSRYKPLTPQSEYTPQILEVLNDESSYRYNIDYSPSFPSLEALRQKIVSACDELGIQIMNIQEFLDKYYVRYSFKTSGKFSIIQFIFNNNSSLKN